MTDLDFDELDNAVNQLMTKNTAVKETAAPADAVTTASSTEETESEVAVSSSSESPAAAAPSLAVKRRGQFMDIMPTTAKPATPLVNRQAATVQPISSPEPAAPEQAPLTENTDANTPPVDDTTAPVTEVTQPAEGESEGSSAEEVTQSSVDDLSVEPALLPDLPDEIVAEAQNNAPIQDTAHASTETPAAEPDEVAIPPLGSPFLPDAKVEKRPLGTPNNEIIPDVASSDTPVETETETVTVATADETPTDESIAVAEAVIADAPLPEELHEDVIALEATTTGESSSSADAPTTTDEPATADTPPATAVSGSIPQQYTEQPSTGDASNGAIYDTATYHTAVDAQPKKKTHIMTWLLWTLVLLALGAAAGAGYFVWTTRG